MSSCKLTQIIGHTETTKFVDGILYYIMHKLLLSCNSKSSKICVIKFVIFFSHAFIISIKSLCVTMGRTNYKLFLILHSIKHLAKISYKVEAGAYQRRENLLRATLLSRWSVKSSKYFSGPFDNDMTDLCTFGFDVYPANINRPAGISFVTCIVWGI